MHTVQSIMQLARFELPHLASSSSRRAVVWRCAVCKVQSANSAVYGVCSGLCNCVSTIPIPPSLNLQVKQQHTDSHTRGTN